MKRYIYALFAATFFLCSCTQELDLNPSSVETLEDGSLSVCFNLNVQSAEVLTVETRANSPEDNIISGWAVVFGADTNYEDNYGDDS
ncbi:MAG: hypothetical protein R3Y15_05790, partial [Rikenellaceae bacterium]